ncbi:MULTISPECIES: 23S rRNA (uracil(1939)-C(5))-methyltransferase RlmD [Halomonadaceae]|uniref:23S rRNA (uracil(1939)-C(5))-methyltransferase RlmD n=1 Tax=Halomonadaceae TaxID=28256 RepID=UPI00159A29D8|nr:MULTISPECIES: 23S rRNA (uracil(1939)-C(5))-methyltransferase RlmD [Halomonas]QJQ94715.1 23S rRNA (uracil(1939)-C(5))-methyltransferase RlmD [Halomonas sp. PA5]
MAMLGKRRTARPGSGKSGLAGKAASVSTARQAPTPSPDSQGDAGLEILRLAHDGRGVSRDAAGKTVFIDRALPGERVEVAIHRTRKRYDEAHVRQLLVAAPERVAPRCVHFGHCGGCDLQHLELEAQRRHKQAVLVEQLEQHGVARDSLPTILGGDGYGYRRRARLGVKVDAGGHVHLGFRAKGSHHLMDVQQCPILVPALAELLPVLREHLQTLEAPRWVGHVELLESEAGASLIVRQLREHVGDRERWLTFAEALNAESSERRHAVTLAWLLGREQPELEWLGGTPDLYYRLVAGRRELSLSIAPGDFLQVNAVVNQCLIDTALEWLALRDEERVLDLFAGVGNLSLALASAAGEVVGVEGSPAMVSRLEDNARRNGFASVSARQADLTRPEAVRALLDERDWSLVVLDPPREGAEAVCRVLARRQVPRILYISCDSATLARDTAYLMQGGYRLAHAAMADMFSQTAHMESMLLLERMA